MKIKRIIEAVILTSFCLTIVGLFVSDNSTAALWLWVGFLFVERLDAHRKIMYFKHKAQSNFDAYVRLQQDAHENFDLIFGAYKWLAHLSRPNVRRDGFAEWGDDITDMLEKEEYEYVEGEVEIHKLRLEEMKASEKIE